MLFYLVQVLYFLGELCITNSFGPATCRVARILVPAIVSKRVWARLENGAVPWRAFVFGFVVAVARAMQMLR